MKNKLLIFLYILPIFTVAEIQAQNEIVYKTPRTSGGTEVACAKIQLLPGFSFKASSGNNLTLKVDMNSCSPYGGEKDNFTSNRNYIVKRTYINKNGYLDQIEYYDGLGRIVETIDRGITPASKDLIRIQEYDDFGLESKAWIAGFTSASNNGAYISENSAKNQIYTSQNDPRSYSFTEYEQSPISRPTKQYGVGQSWHDAPVELSYQINNQSKEWSCIEYKVEGTRDNPTLKKNGTYKNGELNITKIVGEEKNISYEFKNKLGQTVLQRQINNNEQLDTYYVYDDFGNLCFVLPPLVENNIDKNTLDLYAYLYKYNNRNLCIYKKFPGCEPIYLVYDKSDQLVFTQDGELRLKNQWLFSFSDIFGRNVLNGICTNKIDYLNNTYSSLSFNAEWKNTTNTLKGYSIANVILENVTLHSVNYYDNYDFINKNEFPNLSFSKRSGFDAEYYNFKNNLTGTITAILDNQKELLYTALYYNKKGLVIQTNSTNHLGGTESEFLAYNFSGQPTKKEHVHTATGKTTQAESYTYSYDHAGRLITSRHKLNTGSEITLAQNTYDELGRLKSTIANSQAALTTNYTYNIRSWTKSINNTHFVETLDYSLNGNIATQTWRQNSKTRKYVFAYDNISRLKSATYTGDGKFGTAYTYDNHGNVKTLTREGLTAAGTYGTIDNLTFNYDGTGNQLKYITDAGPNVALSISADFKDFSKATTSEYTYNKNGALTKDLNKGQTVVYNSLNLPQEMLVNNTTAKGKNYYSYTATGVKLQVKHLSDPTLQTVPVTGTSSDSKYKVQTTTDYVGNKIYENGVLNKTLIDNGYIEGNNYYFYIKDHLGNNRIVASATGSVIQRNNYYPFGMSFGEESEPEQGKQNFKYNGKELDKTHGLNQYDYAARFMDPATVRFTSVDPHAENYFSWSPYVYVGNNPMRLVDPTGKDWYKNEDGTAYMWRKGNDASFTYTIGEGDNAITLEMKNIGETYVDNLADGTQIVWDQNMVGGLVEPKFFNQKESSITQKWANSDNFIVSVAYNVANDLFAVGQKLTFGYFDKTNELTGAGAGTNLDGSINNNEGDAVVNTIAMFSGTVTGKGAATVGATIPSGFGHIKSLEGGIGATVANYGIEIINGSLSRGGIVKSAKSFKHKEK